jgi:hypothetical protein
MDPAGPRRQARDRLQLKAMLEEARAERDRWRDQAQASQKQKSALCVAARLGQHFSNRDKSVTFIFSTSLCPPDDLTHSLA